MEYLIFLFPLILCIVVIYNIYWRIRYGVSGKNRSRDFNRDNGEWQVKYNDGGISEPMCFDVAKEYSAIFGGIVFKKAKNKGCHEKHIQRR